MFNGHKPDVKYKISTYLIPADVDGVDSLLDRTEDRPV